MDIGYNLGQVMIFTSNTSCSNASQSYCVKRYYKFEVVHTKGDNRTITCCTCSIIQHDYLKIKFVLIYQ